MTEINTETVNRPESEIRFESLLKDSSYRTEIFRRHTAYNSRDAVVRGFLTPEGYHLAEQSAQQVVSLLPEGAEVTLTHSPSYMAARRRGVVSEDERSPLDVGKLNPNLTPARAQFTARQYGKELYQRGFWSNEPTVRVNPDGSFDMDGVQKERRLGDFFEGATSGELIGKFYQTLGTSRYKGLTPEFWEDFKKDQLDQEVDQAMVDAGGWGGLKEAKNAEEVIEERKPGSEKKQIDVNITHGETEDSFLYWTSQYLKAKGKEEEAQMIERSTQTGYNLGFETHLNSQDNLVVSFGKNGIVEVGDIKDLRSFLKSREKSSN